MKETVKAVILARGLGTRMRRRDEGAALDPEQARLADIGLKAMIPVGRPFLDYVLSELADAGYREACLVIGPEHGNVRDYYTRIMKPERIRVVFAIQERPLGTADAVSAAESFVAGDHFLVLNSDNYYPPEACQSLRMLGHPGIAVFERESMVRESNIDPARIRQFAVVRTDPSGQLESVIEKPDDAVLASLGPEAYVSMNCWLFGPTIFRACAAIGPSPRGELELTGAVQHALQSLGQRFEVLKFRAGVLDLSSRSDIAAVKAKLQGVVVRP